MNDASNSTSHESHRCGGLPQLDSRLSDRGVIYPEDSRRKKESQKAKSECSLTIKSSPLDLDVDGGESSQYIRRVSGAAGLDLGMTAVSSGRNSAHLLSTVQAAHFVLAVGQL